MSPSLLLDVLVILFLVLCAGFFSIAETAFTASSPGKLHKLKADGSRRANKLLTLFEKKENLISLILFCNNAINIFASSAATAAAIRILQGNEAFAEYAPEIAAAIMTFLILIFGEIVPKTIAINYPEKLAIFSTPIISFLSKFLGPIFSLLNKAIFFALKVFGLSKDIKNVSATELIRSEIEYFHSQGSVVKNERDMLDGVLDLVETDVESIMTHRKDVDMIDIDDDMSEIVLQIEQSGHSRLPIYKERQENIIGVLHLRDFFVLTNRKKTFSKDDIVGVLIKPMFVSPNTRLKNQLIEFKKKRSHMAIVVDEYGGMMGVVTLEDVIEEIVGNIEDEHDERGHQILAHEDGSYSVFGDTLLRDFNRETGKNFESDEAATVAGIVIEYAEKIPEEGEQFEIVSHIFTVLKKDFNKILLVKIQKKDNEISGAVCEDEYIDRNSI